MSYLGTIDTLWRIQSPLEQLVIWLKSCVWVSRTVWLQSLSWYHVMYLPNPEDLTSKSIVSVSHKNLSSRLTLWVQVVIPRLNLSSDLFSSSFFCFNFLSYPWSWLPTLIITPGILPLRFLPTILWSYSRTQHTWTVPLLGLAETLQHCCCLPSRQRQGSIHRHKLQSLQA